MAMKEYKQYIGKVKNCDCDIKYCGFLKIGNEYSDVFVFNLLEGFIGKKVKITVEVINEG